MPSFPVGNHGIALPDRGAKNKNMLHPGIHQGPGNNNRRKFSTWWKAKYSMFLVSGLSLCKA
jgi:hypothetical protein